MLGKELIKTLHTLPKKGACAALLRHTARYPIADPNDPTQAEITPEGAASAEQFGARIEGFDHIRIFHSPVKRCGQTAECIARGLGSRVDKVELLGPQGELGIDYIRNLLETGRLTQKHGDRFMRLWFTGQVPRKTILPAPEIARTKLAYLVERMDDPLRHGRRLDLHVSHDWNVLILRELMLGIRYEDTVWLDFLDGVAFERGRETLTAVYRDRSLTGELPWRFE